MAARAVQRGSAGGSEAGVGRLGGRVVVRQRGRVPVRTIASGSELASRRLTGLGVKQSQVAGIQRSRILAATIRALDEVGYTDMSVASIVSRSRISRRTFYEMFANREDCLVAVIDDTLERLEVELAKIEPGDGDGWRAQLRMGLWVILSFLDREPVLARVCVVQALSGGAQVLARREEAFARLAAVVDGGRSAGGGRARESMPLTAEGLVGAAFTIVHARLSRRDSAPLRGLVGELMAMIVLPYQGPAAARSELRRPAPAPLESREREGRSATNTGGGNEQDVFAELPMRLTHRTARVLEAIADNPGSSNRVVGNSAGALDPGQISKLLRRLARIGLIANTSAGHAQGEPNAWRLTPLGQRVNERLRLTKRDARPEGGATHVVNTTKKASRASTKSRNVDVELTRGLGS